MAYVSKRIQADTDTWLILREYPSQPKAVIQRVTDTAGAARYLVYTWEPIAADRRMVSIHDDLEAADKSVPWPSGTAGVPPLQSAPAAEHERHQRRRRRMQAKADRSLGKRVPVEPVPPSEAWD